MGDEGLGVHTIRALEERGFPPPQLANQIELLDGGSGGFTLVGDMEKADHILMVDATADEKKIGSIEKLTPHFTADYPVTLTAHDVGLKDMLDVFYLLGKPAHITLFTVTIDLACCRLGIGLSTPIQNILPKLCEAVEQEAALILQELSR